MQAVCSSRNAALLQLTLRIVRKLLWMLLVLWGITLISFWVIHLAPGSPTDMETTLNPLAGEAARQRLEALYGLDKPLHVQYLDWLSRLVRLDFGLSMSADGRPVLDKIMERLPLTVGMNVISLILTLVIAIPITLGSAGLQIINLFDTMIYMRRLTGALAWSSDAADTAKGIYNFCQTIFNLPCSLITPITISIIPTVTAALTKGNTAGARHTEESAVRTMSLIAMPCAVGLAVLSEPIIRLLARNYGPESVATAAPILAYLGIAVIFNSTVLLFNAIMQAHGDVTTPVVNMLIGGVVKVVVNYILVAIPSLNIIGAAIGTIVCYVTITVLDLIAMRRSVTTRPAIFRNVIRPAAAAGIMGAATFFAAALLRSFTDSNTVVCLGALIAAVVVYVIFVVVLRCITYEDCMLLPKGEKIAKILHIKQKT